jgi:hypothetical protein
LLIWRAALDGIVCLYLHFNCASLNM